jgi:hypothetical protein
MKKKMNKFERLLANLDKAMSNHNQAVIQLGKVASEYERLQKEKQAFLAVTNISHTIE